MRHRFSVCLRPSGCSDQSIAVSELDIACGQGEGAIFRRLMQVSHIIALRGELQVDSSRHESMLYLNSSLNTLLQQLSGRSHGTVNHAENLALVFALWKSNADEPGLITCSSATAAALFGLVFTRHFGC